MDIVDIYNYYQNKAWLPNDCIPQFALNPTFLRWRVVEDMESCPAGFIINLKKKKWNQSFVFGLWACWLNQIEYKDQKIKEVFLASK